MDNTLINLILIIAGILAGTTNFFINFKKLPFAKLNDLSLEDTQNHKWWTVLLGYVIVGVSGAYLTYLINALIGLKGLELEKNFPKDVNYYYILLGYGIIFGYSTTKLLISILSAIIKKVLALDNKVKSIDQKLTQKNL
ncbi:hypothetical protein BH10BAC5_BH10BAC5_20070 [soil metagenome]